MGRRGGSACGGTDEKIVTVHSVFVNGNGKISPMKGMGVKINVRELCGD